MVLGDGKFPLAEIRVSTLRLSPLFDHGNHIYYSFNNLYDIRQHSSIITQLETLDISKGTKEKPLWCVRDIEKEHVYIIYSTDLFYKHGGCLL